MIRSSWLVLTLGLFAAAAHGAPSGTLLTVRFPNASDYNYTLAQLQRFPERTVQARGHGGEEHSYTGVALGDLLRDAGTPSGSDFTAGISSITRSRRPRTVIPWCSPCRSSIRPTRTRGSWSPGHATASRCPPARDPWRSWSRTTSIRRAGCASSAASLAVPKDPPLAQVDSKVYDAYVGTYELAPGVTYTVTREGAKLFGQRSGRLR